MIFKQMTTWPLIVALSCLAAASSNAQSLKDSIDSKVYEVPATYPHPSYDEGNIKALFYDGVDYKGKAKRTFAYVGIPKSDNPVPAMVLVHGGGGTAFQQWVKIWNDRGYAAIAMDLEGHVPKNIKLNTKRKGHPHSGPSRVGQFADAKLPLQEQWMYHAVSDILTAHTLLASFPEVDAERIGVTGISWGGILSSLVSGIDSRYKCAIPVYGGGYLYESHGYFKSVDTEAKKFWDPARYFANGTVPTLWVNGDSDGHFSVNITSHSFDTTIDHAFLCIHPSMPHGHGPAWNPQRVPEIYAFADHVLKGEPAGLGRIVKQPTTRKLELTFDSKTAIDSATVYYLNEPITYRAPKGAGKGKHPGPGQWLELKADVDAKNSTVKADLPISSRTYYVNLRDERGHVVSSTLVELDEAEKQTP